MANRIGFLLLIVLVVFYGWATLSIRPTYQEQPVRQETAGTYYEINLSLIRRIRCYDPISEKMALGTSFIISHGTMITAAHVLRGYCVDDYTGKPVWIGYNDEDSDFAILNFIQESPIPQYIQFSCKGYQPRQIYRAVGFFHGKELRETTLKSREVTTHSKAIIDGKKRKNLRIFDGALYSGMSGGPVFDQHGVVIGINTATNPNEKLAFSRDLRDTVLCQPALDGGLLK